MSFACAQTIVFLVFAEEGERRGTVKVSSSFYVDWHLPHQPDALCLDSVSAQLQHCFARIRLLVFAHVVQHRPPLPKLDVLNLHPHACLVDLPPGRCIHVDRGAVCGQHAQDQGVLHRDRGRVARHHSQGEFVDPVFFPAAASSPYI